MTDLARYIEVRMLNPIQIKFLEPGTVIPDPGTALTGMIAP